MKYRKFNKYEKKENQKEHLRRTMGGSGLYLYENSSNADLTLPRPTSSGIREIGPRQQFQGDNYYMQLVKSGYLRFIKELQSPEQEKEAEAKALVMEQNMDKEDKLILDQPDIITEGGKVEHVPTDGVLGQQPLNEVDGEEQPQPDVLINESPVDGGFVIVD